MSRNRLIYITLTVALLIFSAAYQSRISAVLLIAALCYPLLAAVCVLICSRTSSADFVENTSRNGSGSSTRIVRQKGEEFDLWIYVHSRSVFPCAPIELQCNLPDRETGLFSMKRIYASVPPFGRCRIAVTVMHRYRGAYVAEISRAVFYDPLRIIRITRKIRSEATLIFQPRKMDFGELIAEAPGEENTDPSLLLKGEREDFSHVREYVQGDVMQLVHWKLTAKLDELMIKQYDQTAERRTAVLCDYRNDITDTGAAMKYADAVIEAAIAVALASVKAGINSIVDFGAIIGNYRCDIRDMADFERFYDMAAVIPTKVETMELRQLITEGQQGASVVFVITGMLTEELVAMLDIMAEGFRGLMVLANVSPGQNAELETRASRQHFEYVPIKMKDAN